MTAIDLNSQKELDANPKANQKIHFTRNLDTAGKTILFFIVEEAKENILDFWQGTAKSIINLFYFNIK